MVINKIVFTLPEALVEFSQEKNKTSALLKNPFAFHLGTYVNLYSFERSMNSVANRKSPITNYANPGYAKNVR